MRRCLLRVTGYGYGTASADAALLRNVWTAADPRTWRAIAAADSNKDRIQAGEVSDQLESDQYAAESWLLGRPGLLGFLRVVVFAVTSTEVTMASHALEIENLKTGEVTEAVFEHTLDV